MIYVKMLEDAPVNGFERKTGEIVKTDHWTAISLVRQGKADFTDNVPKEVADKAKKAEAPGPESTTAEPEENEVKKAEDPVYETAMAEPPENEMRPRAKARKHKGRRK